jgi:uncharacterized protein YbjT (DUF2867 family)
MPVLVTAADTAAGRATVLALLRGGGQVRAWVGPEPDRSGAAEWLRGRGVKVGRGDLDDEGRMEEALEQAHSVVHLAGGLLDDPASMVEDAASVLSAALGAGCRRLLWVSAIGAGNPDGNPYLEACAAVERLLEDAPMETIVLRRALTYGPGDELTGLLARGAPEQARHSRHVPLHTDDLATAIAVADQREKPPGDLHLVLSVGGPEEVTLEQFAAMLGWPGGEAAPDLPPHLVAWLAEDRLPGADALAGLGTSLRAGTAQLRAEQGHTKRPRQ